MHQAQHVLRSALAALCGPQFAILALALGLAFAWFGPAALALVAPFALMLVPRGAAARGGKGRRSAPSGQMAEMTAMLDHRLRAARRARHPVLCITLAIQGFDGVAARLGDRLVTTCLDGLSHGLRREDALFDLGGGHFGIIPDGAGGMDGAAARRLAARLQAHAAASLSGIRRAEGLTIASGLCLETQPGTRSARAVIADSLAATGASPPASQG
jgi:GGDEF domain-containing protein